VRHRSGVVLLWVCGCALPSVSTRVPSTHLIPDGVVVEPLGPAHGRATKVCGVAGFIDEHPDELMTRQATRQAIDAIAHANALIDVTTSSAVLDYLLFSMCRVEVVGTAVRISAAPADG
jgi:hypothetical protein